MVVYNFAVFALGDSFNVDCLKVFLLLCHKALTMRVLTHIACKSSKNLPKYGKLKQLRTVALPAVGGRKNWFSTKSVGELCSPNPTVVTCGMTVEEITCRS